jgi:molybdenum cofactor cytidylyltransferase
VTNLDHACLILAAGKSSRFGSSKMSHQLATGKTILETTVALYTDFFSSVSVVLNAQDSNLPILEAALDGMDVRIIHCANASQGLSQSLIAGLKCHLDSESILIGLGDMPYINKNTIAQLKSAMTATNIAVPMFQHKAGNPVSFGQTFYPALLNLQGDEGGKPVRLSNPNLVHEVEVDDAAILLDIDTPEQLLSIP